MLLPVVVILLKAGHQPITEYWTILIQSTGVVVRDPFYLFEISAATKFVCDTSKISTFEPKFSLFSTV
jgi:hypothetical protein